ncbi:hypothetical protein [Iningainema tapete]|uniref:Uncharacterized protein n=1 Tax=Iningainema tapete BLCC-T55 TaxID=2748662 RepID=A0A8J6XQD9_9CYAN|nr:hypothetical protein [Iningainema tapete]MBD2776305.1 hypothetical protein [Iningainema tapete BLCC-T55]
MPQDNDNSQPPYSSEPEANQSESTLEQVTQPPQKPYQTVQPFWKAKTIQILKGTIGVLEATVQKLETEPAPGTVNWWSTVLARLRSLFPALSRLSNTALTGVIVATVTLIVWTGATIFGSKPNEVVTIPPTLETPSGAVATSPQVETSPPPQVEETPSPTPEVTPPPTVEETPPTAVETPPPVEETPALVETPPPVEETPPPEPEPTPTPTIILTPEQTLITAIENQVAQVSDRFASGLIKSIQANFRTSNLTIKISDDWYTLKQSQQEKLAADMLQRSKELDFTHLEIIDSQGRLVARNPVVGTEMIIFQRQALTVPNSES